MAAPKTVKELTEEEVEDYREAFNNFDKSGDGMIDEGELGVVLRSLGYSPTNQQLKEMMAKVGVLRPYGIFPFFVVLFFGGSLLLLSSFRVNTKCA